MSANVGDLTPTIARAFDSARRLRQVCPTGRLFCLRRISDGYGWEPINLTALDSRYSSLNGEIFRGWLPQAALGKGPLRLRIAELDPLSPDVFAETQAFGFMRSSDLEGAQIYAIVPSLTGVPTLPHQREWTFTASYLNEPLFVPLLISPLSAPLPAALG